MLSMKMEFSLTRFTAISFYLVPIFLQIYGELVVIRYPSSDTPITRLTCISEDDDAAIIWNHNPEIESDSFTNFLPSKLKSNNVSHCSVWNPQTCLASWESIDNWTVVQSANRPMGPVLDYRWEGFEEFAFQKSRMDQEYLYVGRVNEYSGTAVFSARGLQDVYVFLCKTANATLGGCLWVILGGWNGTSSAIRSCGDNGTPAVGKFADFGKCQDLTSIMHKDTDVIDPYEWRTFILEWDSEQKTIKVFRDYEENSFLNGTIPSGYNPAHISVRSGKPTRIRFHFYEYILADKENAKLYTKSFQLHEKHFCVKLLVGICPECEMSITLVDAEGGKIKTWNFSSDENHKHRDLLTWQWVKLKMRLPNSDPRNLRLVIETVFNTEEGNGQWAIDNFRICESNDGIRKSTISINQNPQTTVKCQKLSYVESALVNSLSNKTMEDTTQLQRFFHRRKGHCGSACANFGKNSFICDKTGCTCDRGFEGRDCIRECSDKDQFYGYNCKEKCDGCAEYGCNKTTGYCSTGCNTFGYLPPLCKSDFRKQEPTVVDITDTTVKILQKIELGYDADASVFFSITEVESRKNPHVSLASAKKPLMYEAKIKSLKPNTSYNLRTTVIVKMGKDTIPTNSSEIGFTTTCMGKPRYEVLPGQTNLVITMLQRDKICGDRTDLQYSIRVFAEASARTVCNLVVPKLPYKCSSLVPYTEYNVTILQTSTALFSTIVRTLESAPSEPQNLKLTNRGHGLVTLHWEHPSISQTRIKKFLISVELIRTGLRADPGIETTKAEDYFVKHEKKKYSIKLALFPSTTYRISVVAVSENNFKSLKLETEIFVPGSVGFESREKLLLTQSGTLIKLKAPTVLNATVKTVVYIFVKKFLTCAENKSRYSLSFADMRTRFYFKYEEVESKCEYLTIDTVRMEDLASNCSINSEKIEYSITAVVNDSYSNSSANLTSSRIAIIDDVEKNLAWLVIFPIIVVCFLSLLYISYRKFGKWWVPVNRQDVIPLSSMMTSTGNLEAPEDLHLSVPVPVPVAKENRLSIQQSPPDVVPYTPHSYSVQVEEFEEYAKEAMASGLLSSQFALLSKTSTKECKYGKLRVNLLKNRYKGVIPYDETRVVLEKIPGELHSDYINASYIKGHRKERAYIAAQGPLPNTVNDFWRMVWQDKVRVICMLTNVVEDGKTKCEQYWPEVGLGVTYGDILVSNTEHEVFADYTIRTFNLDYQNTKREVRHFHYTGWPDKGVPMHSQSLVAYLKKLLATPTGKGPVVVHCSAGIGRTGTIILCDICLRQAVLKRTFDVPGVTVKIREDRADMVGNIQQYFLAHLIIMESMVYDQTQITCSYGLPKKIKELRKQLPSDVQRLRDTVWQDRALDSLAVTRYSIMEAGSTDEYTEVEPATPTMPQFNRDSIFDSESNYINAVSVDGVKMKKQYLESQLPSPSTISEYWRLINEKRIELILILQTPKRDDPTCCDIMLSDTIFVPVPHIRVETKSTVQEEEHFTTRKFLLMDSSEVKVRQRPVTVLTCTGWGFGKNGKPPTPAALVSLWMASEKISRKEAPTLVLCRDGVTGCGLYLALSFLLERMAVERECDVISAVRAVRRSRTEFVQSLEQFNYLYEAAVNYFECFQTYANFS